MSIVHGVPFTNTVRVFVHSQSASGACPRCGKWTTTTVEYHPPVETYCLGLDLQPCRRWLCRIRGVVGR